MIHLPGALKRRSRVGIGSIVMISHRGFENKGDICYLYSPDDKEFLVSKGYIFEKNSSNGGGAVDDDEINDTDGFVFESVPKPE